MFPFARLVLILIMAVSVSRLGAAESEELASLRTKAEKGNALAQYNLGLAYTQGRLVPVDLPEAFVWLSLASERGTTGKALDSVLGSITDDQLAEGRRRLDLYRAALTAKNPPTNRPSPPRPAARGFRLEAPVPIAPTTPEAESQGPVTHPPEATHLPASSPADGLDTGELAQSRRDLGQARAALQVAAAELAVLRASVASLEAAAATARATETRLTAELETVRKELEAAKPPASPPPVEPGPVTSPAAPRR